jgi:hypothetical protein
MRIFISLLLAILASTSVFGQSVPEIVDGKVTGAGFTLTLPPHITAQVAAGPETLHGFRIDLSPRQLGVPAKNRLENRYIAFDTRWDTGDFPSLDAVVADITSHVMSYLPDELTGNGEVSLNGNFPAQLGTLPARRLVINYRNSAKKPSVRQIIVAYRSRHEAAGIVYLLTLNTTEDSFYQDLSIFSKVIAGFRLTAQ